MSSINDYKGIQSRYFFEQVFSKLEFNYVNLHLAGTDEAL